MPCGILYILMLSRASLLMKYQSTDLKKMNDMKRKTVLNKLSLSHLEILLCVFHFSLCTGLWPLGPTGRNICNLPELFSLHLELQLFWNMCKMPVARWFPGEHTADNTEKLKQMLAFIHACSFPSGCNSWWCGNIF